MPRQCPVRESPDTLRTVERMCRLRLMAVPGLETHHSHPPSGSRYVWATMGLNLAIFIAELVGGVVAGSLALIADSFHNLTDLTALVLVVVARRLQRIPPTAGHTFGYRRADVMAGFINAGILFLAMGAVLARAVEHLATPRPVAGGLMLGIGSFGLVANTLGVWLLRRDPAQDIGLRSAGLHLLTDAASSAAVVAGGWAVWSLGWFRVDPILSLIIAGAAMVGAVAVMREGLHILMEGTPRHLDVGEVTAAMLAVPGVKGVGHVHLWSLASTEPSLTATLVLSDQPLSEAESVLRAVERKVDECFCIRHTVLQVEPGGQAERAGAGCP